MLGGYIPWKVSFHVKLKMKIGGSSVVKLEPKNLFGHEQYNLFDLKSKHSNGLA